MLLAEKLSWLLRRRVWKRYLNPGPECHGSCCSGPSIQRGCLRAGASKAPATRCSVPRIVVCKTVVNHRRLKIRPTNLKLKLPSFQRARNATGVGVILAGLARSAFLIFGISSYSLPRALDPMPPSPRSLGAKSYWPYRYLACAVIRFRDQGSVMTRSLPLPVCQSSHQIQVRHSACGTGNLHGGWLLGFC